MTGAFLSRRIHPVMLSQRRSISRWQALRFFAAPSPRSGLRLRALAQHCAVEVSANSKISDASNGLGSVAESFGMEYNSGKRSSMYRDALHGALRSVRGV
jgi:hypothetical protein